MPAKIYLRFLQIGLFASLFIVFFVFPDLLFPYITSKQLSFNILMELMLVVWLVFIWRYPAYRPGRNYITFGLLAYFIAVLASIAVSVDPILSFWGDAERMLGLFHLLHFLIFYYILITVFRTWAQWRWFLGASVLVAVIVSLIGVFGAGVYSVIGNTAYVSGYLIFNIFFAALLALKARSKHEKFLWLLLILPMLWEFALARTSGAIIGLFIGVWVLVILFGLWYRVGRFKKSLISLSVLAILMIIVLFSQHQAPWFQNSFLKNLSPYKDTFQTRLISWQGAATEFKHHWLFGTGFGNYAVIFDQRFDSRFLDYAKTETYFDRAHNNLIDIASTTGLVGLLTYLSIFLAAAYYLRLAFRRRGESGRLEIALIIALLSAYFIQNLAVFDSYVTYIGLMTILAYIYWLAKAPDEAVAVEPGYYLDEDENTDADDSDNQRRFWPVLSANKEIGVLILFLLLFSLFTYQFNLKPWKMFKGVIVGYANIMEGRLAVGVLDYQEALTGTPLDRDGRATLVNLLTMYPSLLSTVSPYQAGLVLEFGIFLAEENVKANPRDSLMQMQLAQILDTAARYHYQDLNMFNFYSRRAMEAMEYAIEASPGRAPVYLVKAQMLLARGENEAAISTVRYAISLNPNYSESHCRLAQFYMFLKESDALIHESLSACLDLGGAKDINSLTFLSEALEYFAALGEADRALILAERMAALSLNDHQVWFNLAKMYWLAGRIEEAEMTIEQVFLREPALRAEWQEFREGLKSTDMIEEGSD